jgi:hypothetical protein
LPRDLAAALTTAERTLSEHDRLRGALSRTHELIPELLARRADAQSKLAAAEVSGTDAASIRDERLRIESERLSAVARRAGAIEGLLMQEPELRTTRDMLDTARQPYIAGIVNAFSERYAAAVRQLQMLWCESDSLAAALRSDVPAPLPVRFSGGQTPTVQGFGVPECQPVRLHRIVGPVTAPPPIDALAARIGGTLDRLDHAIVFAAGLRETQARQQTGRPYGHGPIDFTATYRVNTPIRSLFDGLEFAPGTLVDVSLLGPIPLSRHLATKGIRLENGGREKAAA